MPKAATRQRIDENGTAKDGTISYTAVVITQGKHRLYTLTMPSEVLKENCTVDMRVEKPISGFQRRLDIRRAKDIAGYIDGGFGTIPGAIVLSAQKAANFQYSRTARTINFRSNPRAFLILDGQHRVFGFHLAKSSMRVPVVIYNGLTKAEEVSLFMDINTKQRPVPNELLLDIKSMANTETNEEELLRSVFDLFSRKSDSPLFGIMSAAEKRGGSISRVTFNAALKSILETFEEQDAEIIYEVLKSYLNAWLIGLRAKESHEAIANPTLFRAIMLLFPSVAVRVNDRHGGQYTVEHFDEILQPLFSKTRKADLKKIAGGHLALFELLRRRFESGFAIGKVR